MVASPSKSAVATDTDFANRLSLQRTMVVASVLTTLIKCATLVACCYFVYLSIAALSGKETLANVGIKVLGNVRFSEGVCAILTGGGILYGVGQRQLRHRAVKRIGKVHSELERRFDPGRSSSGLTDSGTTRPEDKT